MNLEFEHQGRRFYRLAIQTPGEFQSPRDGLRYACLLWSHAPFRESDRWELANKLVDSGCRYAVCGGAESEALHDDIDSAYIRPIVELRPEGEGRELVITTWHEDEAPDEVANFLVENTVYEDGSEFSDFLVLHIGGSPEQQAVVDSAVRRQAFGEPAV